MILDAHVHVWTRARGDYRWLSPELGVLWRDVGPGDHEPWMRAAGIGDVLLVQAADSVEETRFLLDVASKWERVVGVVGWAPLDAPDANAVVAALAAHPHLVGLRPMLQDLSDDAWCRHPDLDAGFDAMMRHDLTFDALVKPRHLPHLLALRERRPDLRIVVDHAAKPTIRRDARWEGHDAWAAAMARLASYDRTWCKLSGLSTEAESGATDADFAPAIDTLMETFGPDRLIFGSDSPVCDLAEGPSAWCERVARWFGNFGPDAAALFYGQNARRAYPRARERTCRPTQPAS